jgi:hypothetical protein
MSLYSAALNPFKDVEIRILKKKNKGEKAVYPP